MPASSNPAANTKGIEAHADFNPATDIPSLEGKVIFITGGKKLT
jgi:hypothetical protein